MNVLQRTESKHSKIYSIQKNNKILRFVPPCYSLRRDISMLFVGAVTVGVNDNIEQK